MMDEEIYISVPLDEYLILKKLEDFLLILRDNNIEEWEGWHGSVEEFLLEHDIDDTILPF